MIPEPELPLVGGSVQNNAGHLARPRQLTSRHTLLRIAVGSLDGNSHLWCRCC
jgi:hypothetical protein